MKFINNIFPTSKERYVLLPIVLFVSLVAISFAYYFGGGYFAVSVILPLITFILTISKSVWSADTAQTKVAKISIAAILLLVLGTSLSPTVTGALLEPLYEVIPGLKGQISTVPVSLPVMIITSVVIVLINLFMRDTSAMNKHSTPLGNEFPEPEYKERLKRFCAVFKDDLDRIEREGNWSSEFFVQLEAEVEIRQATKVSKKKKDLLYALKNEKNAKTFLVIGQPGSGKSVALRKLCRDLLEEVDRTGKVPIYVNLKEWSSVAWSKENPPNRDDFHKFILQNLKNQGDRFTDEFLGIYFDRMVETGRVFFIFDSFDEIPALLENEDSDWILDEISLIIHKYLNGAHESRGVVATRPYKRPSNKLSTDSTIQILPFSEKRVAEAIEKYPSVSKEAVKELLTTRRDLLPIAKNPFYCALIVNYLKDNNQLPQNRSDLFKSYIEKRLDQCATKIDEKGLTQEEVIEICQQIADLMFNSDTYGFEYPITELQDQIFSFEEYGVKKVVEILVYSKIGRHSNNEKTLFTFAHKRFAEYFAVLSLLNDENKETLKDIHNDGKWRDVLVLLAELEDDEKSYSIALYTWQKLVEANNEIVKTGKTYSLTAIHGLRFLRDAYLSRKHVVGRLQHLPRYIWYQITKADTILEKKIALECVGLLDQRTISLAVTEAFRQNNSWLSETALKSCFYLNNIEPPLKKSLLIYIDSVSIFSFLRRFNEFLFILKLSSVFSELVNFIYVRLFDSILIIFLYVCHTYQNPIVAFIYLLAVLLKFDEPGKKADFFSPLGVMFLRLQVVSIPLFALGITNILNLLLSPTGYQIMRWEVPSWLVLLNLFAAVPFYQIYYYFVKFKKSREISYNVTGTEGERVVESSIEKIVEEQENKRELKNFEEVGEGIKSIFKFIVFAFIVIVIYSILEAALPDNLKSFAHLTWGLFLLVAGHSTSFGNIYYRISDRRQNISFAKSSEFTRQAISDHFYKLKTSEGRLKFVNSLSLMGSVPSGEWTNKLPNINDDEASVKLAQLEESWRNLDR